MKTLRLLLICLVNTTAYSQWNQMDVENCQHITSIFCPTNDTCYMIGMYGYLQKSTNQGVTWSRLNTGTTTNLNDCYFTDANTGYVCGADGFLMKTVDGGNNWTTLYTPDSFQYWFWDIEFTNELTGYVVGDYGGFYKTIDGGANWTKVNIPNAGSIGRVQFVNDSVGYITDGAGYAKKTTNGGNSWSNMTIPGLTTQITALHFPNADYGYAISGLGECAQTKDGGATWNFITDFTNAANTTLVISGCFFVDSITGFAISNLGTIHDTQNGGQSWGMTWPTGNALTHVYFQNKNIGYVTGLYRTALKYGVANVGIKSSNTTYTNFEIYPNPMSISGMIKVDYSQIQSLVIYDLNGKELQEYSYADNGTIQINGNEFNMGMYLVKAIYRNGTLECKKLIVE